MYVKDQRPYQTEDSVDYIYTQCTFNTHVHCDYARSNLCCRDGKYENKPRLPICR